MTDFREPIGIPTSNEPTSTPRIGIAPFGEGEIKTIRYKARVGEFDETIASREIPVSGLGTLSVCLMRSIQEDPLKKTSLSTENAVGINDMGEIIIGKTADFVRQGYYDIGIETSIPAGSPLYSKQDIKLNLWIDGSPDMVQSHLVDAKASMFVRRSKDDVFRLEESRWGEARNWELLRGDERQNTEALFISGRENLLRRLRINFEARMQPPKI